MEFHLTDDITVTTGLQKVIFFHASASLKLKGLRGVGRIWDISIEVGEGRVAGSDFSMGCFKKKNPLSRKNKTGIFLYVDLVS